VSCLCERADAQGRKYPIIDDIPRMLIEIGDKYVDTPVEELGEPKE
jgi:uncharacterized protein YbaR (Trm112 family)